jgi:hypothetical protein
MNMLILILFIVAVVVAVWRFNGQKQPKQPSKSGGGRSEYPKKEQDR